MLASIPTGQRRFLGFAPGAANRRCDAYASLTVAGPCSGTGNEGGDGTLLRSRSATGKERSMLPASTTGRSGASLPDAHEEGSDAGTIDVTPSARSTSLPSGRIAAVTAVSASLPTLNIAKTMIRPAEATTKYASNQNIEPTLRWTHSDRPALLCEVKPLYG